MDLRRTFDAVGAISPTVSWRELSQHTALSRPELLELSSAERVVVSYVCRGLSNKEIAVALGKSEYTVKHQVSACLGKLGVSTRTRLMAILS